MEGFTKSWINQTINHSNKKARQLSVGLIFTLIFWLPAEIIKSDVLVRDSEILSHFLHRLVHQRRTAEVQFDFFGFRMLA